MATNTRLTVTVVSSQNSDYSEPEFKPPIAPYKLTSGNEENQWQRLEVGTSDTTVSLANYTTIDHIIVANTDSTNFVLAKYRTEKATKTFAADALGFNDADPDTITDDDSTFLSALYFEEGDYAVVTNATEAGNNGTFLVQTAAAGTLTLANAVSLTADADDAGTPTIVSVAQNEEKVTFGQPTVLNNVRPGDDLILIADSAAVTVQIAIVGS